MNTSTHSNLNSSLSNLNSSTLSSFSPCCPHEQQYRSLYQQFSTLRMEHRALKQQALTLRNTSRGLEEENSLLKQFLNKKKEIIQTLNQQSQQGNQEINRLEDQLNISNMENGRLQEMVQSLEEQFHIFTQSNELITQQLITANRKYDSLLEQSKQTEQENLQNLRVEKEEKEKALQRGKADLQVAIQTLLQCFSSNSPRLSHLSSLKQPKRMTSTIHIDSNPSNQLNSIDKNMNTLLQAYQHHQQMHQSQLASKTSEISTLTQKITQLQTQLSESTKLFQQQMSQMDKFKTQLKEKEIEHNEIKSTITANSQQREGILTHIIKKLSHLLKSELPSSTPILEKLLQLQPKKFQSQILLNELYTLSTQHYSQTLKHSLQSKQLQCFTKDCSQLQQRYELLHLKHNTLSREYKYILDDNERLIKYNQLTEHRINRNIKTLRQRRNREASPLGEKSNLKVTVRYQQNKENQPYTCNQ